MTGRRPDDVRADTDARFDRDLARAARGLVTEGLPRGILDAGLAPGAGLAGAVRGRRPVPVVAGAVAALVLLLASAIALAPGGFPPASPVSTPTPSLGGAIVHGAFRPTLDIRADFLRLRYSCVPGRPLSSVGPSASAPVREGLVCTAPADAGPYISAVIVTEAADGRPVEVHVKADLTADDTAGARSDVAVPLAKAVAIAASDHDAGNQLAQWVIRAVRTLEPSTATSTELLGYSVKIVRSASGGYQLIANPI